MAQSDNRSSEADESNETTGKEQIISTPLTLSLARATYPQNSGEPDKNSYKLSDGTLDDKAYQEALSTYYQYRLDIRNQAKQYKTKLNPFVAETTSKFLSNAGMENSVYSPVNIFIALSMLAETCNGNSRAQILSLAGAKSIEELRNIAKSVWLCEYSDNGKAKRVMASSIWLSNSHTYRQETIHSLANNYFVSSFSGKMGSDELNNELRSWLNKQTDGLLDQETNSITLTADTIMSLATTVCFKDMWDNKFSGSDTSNGIFHSSQGDIEGSFMHQTERTGHLFYDTDYTAVRQSFKTLGSMWFLLPNKGVSIESFINGDSFKNFIKDPGSQSLKYKFIKINKSIPKFDVKSNLDIIDKVKQLGVTDIFDINHSDFSPLVSSSRKVFIDKINHAARVTVDEEGCKAVAYTVMMAATSAMPPDEEVDFVLDRPFVFVITDDVGFPVFVGVVNKPF